LMDEPCSAPRPDFNRQRSKSFIFQLKERFTIVIVDPQHATGFAGWLSSPDSSFWAN